MIIDIIVLAVLAVPVLFAARAVWRRTSVDAARKVAYLCAAAFVVLSAYTVHLARESSAVNRKILDRIVAQTNPAALARQQHQIDQILLEVDCNTREAFQEAIRQLVDLGIPEAGSITIVTTRCDQTTGVSTTTTP